MSPFRPEVVLLAVLVSAPALWAALVSGTLPLDVALVRFLAALAVCAVGCGLLRSLVGGYAAAAPRRRRTDPPSGTGPGTPPE